MEKGNKKETKRHLEPRRSREGSRARVMAATVVIPIPVDDEEVKAVASLVLSTNSVRFEVGDDEDAIRGKVRDALAIARCASVSEKETCGRTIEDVVSSLRAADEAFAREDDDGGAGTRGGDAPGRETAAYGLAMRSIADAMETAGRDEASSSARVVFERAMAELKSAATVNLGAAAAAAARSERGSATAGALDPACEDMFRWARARGAEYRIEGRVVHEGMREARATESIEAGECAARVPWSALLGVEQVVRASSSPMCEVLKQLTGTMSDQVIMVVWLTAALSESSESESEWAPALRALPCRESTALAWNPDAMRLVLGEEHARRLIEYQQSVRKQYDMLFPALCAQVPEAFPLEIFGEYRRFALAHDVWTSYAMKVQDPASLCIREVIVPGVYLCNHALHAHSVRYTSLERDTNAFRLELARGASPGEPITISYGRLENVELVAYYGFSLANNPYDRLPFTIPGFDPSNIDDARAEALRRASAAAALDVSAYPPRVAADGSLDRFLAQMRALYAPQKVIEWSDTLDGYHPFVVVDVDAECDMLRALAGYVKDAAEEMRESAARVAARPRDGTIHGVDGVDIVADATFWYRAGQLRIAESVIERINALLTEYSRKKRTRDRRDA